MFLAFKEIKKEKKRFILIISIFVLISYLVYFLLGLSNGLAQDNRTAVDRWNTKQIILSSGSNSNITTSMMEKNKLEQQLKNKDYTLINFTRSVVYKNSIENPENTINIGLMGMDLESDKFPEIIEGEKINGDDEVIASLSLKEKEKLQLGDYLKLSMNGKTLKIVGFTNDYKFNISPVVYTKLEQASLNSIMYDNIAGMPEMISAVLIDSNDKIEIDKEYQILSISKFIDQLPGYYAQILTFSLMIGFLMVISAIVLGVFLYIITIQKTKTFGIMKIQGISNYYIGKSVLFQTMIISILGLSIGFILTLISDLMLPVSVPFRLNSSLNIWISGIIIVTSLIGSFFSVKSISNIDPLDII